MKYLGKRKKQEHDKHVEEIKAAIEGMNESNAILTDYVKKLGFTIEKTLQKVDRINSVVEETLQKIDGINSVVEETLQKVDGINSMAEDIKIRTHDSQDELQDIKVRVQDVQDRVYDTKAMTQDAQIRVQNIQDKLYDTSFQLKSYHYQDKLFYWQMLAREGEALDEAKKRFFQNLPQAQEDIYWKQKNEVLILKRVCQVCDENALLYWLDFGTLLGAYRQKGFIPWDDDVDIGMFREDAAKLLNILKEDAYLDIYSNFSISTVNLNHIYRIILKGAEIQCFVDIFVYDHCGKNGINAWKLYRKTRKLLVSEAQRFLEKGIPEKDEHGKPLRWILTEKKMQEEAGALVEKYRKMLLKQLDDKDNSQSMIWGIENLTLGKGYRSYPTEMLLPVRKIEFEGMFFNAPNAVEQFLKDRYGDFYDLPDDILSHQHIKVSEADINILRKTYEKCTGDMEISSAVGTEKNR